jgi:molybdenum cofactor sulfurtransferase
LNSPHVIATHVSRQPTPLASTRLVDSARGRRLEHRSQTRPGDALKVRAMGRSGVEVVVPATGPQPSRAGGLRDDPDWDGEAVDALRAREYARLDDLDQVYLDYTGGSLYAESQVIAHQRLLRAGVFGNPHSTNPASDAATRLADEARGAVLAFLNASPDEYDVVFTANSSAALRLVGEAYPFDGGSRLLLTTDNHNSVHGIREFARVRGGALTYAPLTTPDLRVDGEALVRELDRAPAGHRHLFAYPAQSNYSGVRHPLEWIEAAQRRGWDVLLDAAAFVPATRLDLSTVHPDFVAVSWYKVFGYPTGIGSLVVRREALAGLRRPWFAGGTIGVASVVVPRHTWGEGHVGFEDGTADYLGLPGIAIGLRHVETIGLAAIHRRVQALTRHLLGTLADLRHANGAPAIRLYGPTDDVDRGGTIAFNVIDGRGRIVGYRDVEAAAAEQGISIRAGCFCNPGASETARGITADEMTRVFALGHKPGVEELESIMPGKAQGAVRVSVGIATNERDVNRFMAFLEGFAARLA